MTLARAAKRRDSPLLFSHRRRSMTKTPIWDVAFLKARERDAQEEVEQAQFEADWEEADARFSREFCDTNNCFRLCPLRACRRARRCMSDELLCVDLLPAKCPHAAAQPRIEEIYAEIQQQRRDAAEEQAAEESADDIF
jgi:hypothetical protein